MDWQLQQATAEDEERLYVIHQAAMRQHVEPVWGWDEADQRARFRAAFEPARASLILVAGECVGLLRVDDRGHELFLASIELAPASQRQGLGTEIVKAIIEHASTRGIPVRLQVLQQNPARRLYERIGFQAIAETATHVVMVHDGSAKVV